MPLSDSINAFVAHGFVEREGAQGGPLAGLTFAVKDLFDLEGVATGAGNPDWLRSHSVPTRTAPLVQALLDAGARLVGKTHTDELAWSLSGENFHYGTPENVAAPRRIPGGSSSGSAAATAAGLVDFALGTDTGGSVRLPASYCGLFGLRPTHGRLSLEGAMPLAESYDAAGWFARDPEIFVRVGRVLLGEPDAAPTTRLLVADDMFERAEAAMREALVPALARLEQRFGQAEHVVIAGDDAPKWREVYRVIQSAEAWANHGAWVEAEKPVFGPGVKERFEVAPKVTAGEVEAAWALRREIASKMDALILPKTLLILPTVPGIAPLRGTPEPELAVFRARALEMLGTAGHAGTPQISLPAGFVDGCPVGLSAVAARGEDWALLDLVSDWPAR